MVVVHLPLGPAVAVAVLLAWPATLMVTVAFGSAVPLIVTGALASLASTWPPLTGSIVGCLACDTLLCTVIVCSAVTLLLLAAS